MKKYLSLFLATIMLSATLMGCSISIGGDDDTIVEGKTFAVNYYGDELIYSINKIEAYSFCGGELIKIWLDVTNNGFDPVEIYNNEASFFAPDGVEAKIPTLDDSADKTPNGKSINVDAKAICTEACYYSTDGEYTMRFDSGAEFKFNVEQKSKEEGGLIITYPSTDGDKVVQEYSTN